LINILDVNCSDALQMLGQYDDAIFHIGDGNVNHSFLAAGKREEAALNVFKLDRIPVDNARLYFRFRDIV
jgi:hypothetical protein